MPRRWIKTKLSGLNRDWSKNGLRIIAAMFFFAARTEMGVHRFRQNLSNKSEIVASNFDGVFLFNESLPSIFKCFTSHFADFFHAIFTSMQTWRKSS